MTPTKLLFASAISVAVLLAGCAGEDQSTEGQDAGDANSDLYQGDAAPQPGENVPGDAAANDTAGGTGVDGNGTTDAVGTSG